MRPPSNTSTQPNLGLEIPLALENPPGHIVGAGGNRVCALCLQQHAAHRCYDPQANRFLLGPAIARAAARDRRLPGDVPRVPRVRLRRAHLRTGRGGEA